MTMRILFDLKKEYYFNALFPLYQEMAKDPDYDLFFHVGKNDRRVLGFIPVSDRKMIQQSLCDQGYQVTDSTRGFDGIICGDALKFPERFDDVPRFHVDHGMGIKTLRIRNIYRQKNVRYHVFLEGQYWYDYIQSLGWEGCADFHITGIPKLDPFFKPGLYNNDQLIRRLGLDPQKKTVLFAPSYKPSCIPFLKKKILDLAIKYNVVVKLHPYSYGGKYAPVSQGRLYVLESRKRENFYLIPREEFDIYPYLYLADTLISDTSSVVNEFLSLGKIGVIFVLPYSKLNHSDGMPVLSIDPEEWLRDAYPHITRADDLEAAIDRALKPTMDMIQRMDAFRQYFFTGLDGKSAERVKAKIDSIMKYKE